MRRGGKGQSRKRQSQGLEKLAASRKQQAFHGAGTRAHGAGWGHVGLFLAVDEKSVYAGTSGRQMISPDSETDKDVL